VNVAINPRFKIITTGILENCRTRPLLIQKTYLNKALKTLGGASKAEIHFPPKGQPKLVILKHKDIDTLIAIAAYTISEEKRKQLQKTKSHNKG